MPTTSLSWDSSSEELKLKSIAIAKHPLLLSIYLSCSLASYLTISSVVDLTMFGITITAAYDFSQTLADY